MTYIAFIFQVHKIYAIEKTVNGQAKKTGVSRWLQDNGNSRLFTKASLVVCEQATADRGEDGSLPVEPGIKVDGSRPGSL